MRDGIRALLKNVPGIEVVAQATNGLEVVSTVKRTKPDLAVIDIKMPYANGAEAFVEIKRWSPATRAVIITGLSLRALFNELVDAGIHGLFLKHGDPAERSTAQDSCRRSRDRARSAETARKRFYCNIDKRRATNFTSHYSWSKKYRYRPEPAYQPQDGGHPSN